MTSEWRWPPPSAGSRPSWRLGEPLGTYSLNDNFEQAFDEAGLKRFDAGAAGQPQNVFDGFTEEAYALYQARRAAYEGSSRPLDDMLRWHDRHADQPALAGCRLALTRALLVKILRSPSDRHGGWKAVAVRRGATVFLAEVAEPSRKGGDSRVLWSGLRFQASLARPAEGAAPAGLAGAKQMVVVPASLSSGGGALSVLVFSGVDCVQEAAGGRACHWLSPEGRRLWVDMACTQWRENARRPGQPFLAPQKALEYILKLEVLEIPSLALGMRDDLGEIRNRPGRLLSAQGIASMTHRQALERDLEACWGSLAEVLFIAAATEFRSVLEFVPAAGKSAGKGESGTLRRRPLNESEEAVFGAGASGTDDTEGPGGGLGEAERQRLVAPSVTPPPQPAAAPEHSQRGERHVAGGGGTGSPSARDAGGGAATRSGLPSGARGAVGADWSIELDDDEDEDDADGEDSEALRGAIRGRLESVVVLLPEGSVDDAVSTMLSNFVEDHGRYLVTAEVVRASRFGAQDGDGLLVQVRAPLGIARDPLLLLGGILAEATGEAEAPVLRVRQLEIPQAEHAPLGVRALATTCGLRVVRGGADGLETNDLILAVGGELLRGSPGSVGARFRELARPGASVTVARSMPAPWIFGDVGSLGLGAEAATTWWNIGEPQQSQQSGSPGKRPQLTDGGKFEGEVVKVMADRNFGFVREGHVGAGELFFSLDTVQGTAGLPLCPGDLVSGVRQIEQSGRARAGRLVAVALRSRQRRAAEVFDHVEKLLGQLEDEQHQREAVLYATSSPAFWSRVVEDLAEAEREGPAAADGHEDTNPDVRQNRDDLGRLAARVADKLQDKIADLPCQSQELSVSQVFFTQGDISPKFGAGGSFATLIGHLLQGKITLRDPRLELMVVRLGGRYRSLNNRRLYNLKQFQKDCCPHEDIKVPARVYKLCRVTARVILSFCLARKVSMIRARQAALETIVADADAHARAVESTATRVQLGGVLFLGLHLGLDSPHPLVAIVDGAVVALDDAHCGWKSARSSAGGYVQARAHPLCPLTMKFLRHCSSENDGVRVAVRLKTVTADWVLSRMFGAALELARRLRAPRVLEAFSAALGPPALAALREDPGGLAEPVVDFCGQLARSCPQAAQAACPVLHGLLAAGRLPADRLFGLFEALASSRAWQHSGAVRWRHTPAVPSCREVGEALAGVARPAALPSVLIDRPYASREAYFDTYFRLLREDAHHGLRESLACLREGQPCEDGSAAPAVFVGCGFADADRADGRLKLQFRIELPPERLRRASRHWMYRNLVILLAGQGAFVERALLMRHESSGGRAMVWLECCDRAAPGGWTRVLLDALRQGVLLVFSPTYFYPFEPVLKALQLAEEEPFSFEAELVAGQPSTCSPMALSESVDCSALRSLDGTRPDNGSVLCVCGASASTADFGVEVPGGSAPINVRGLFVASSGKEGHLWVETSGAAPIMVVGAASGLLGDLTLQPRPHPGARLLSPGDAAEVQEGAWLVACYEEEPTVFRVVRKRGCLVGAVALLEDQDVPLRLDPSQREAAAYALRNRVALIQGPPGTGKTLLGHALLEMLLPRRVLVVTYKNHCLDEFLLKCEKSSFVRIGGSRHPELDERNLRSLKRSLLSPEGRKKRQEESPAEVQLRIRHMRLRDEVQQLRARARGLLRSSAAALELSAEVFLRSTTNEQLALFLGRPAFQRMQAEVRRKAGDQHPVSCWFSFIRDGAGAEAGPELAALHQRQRAQVEDLLLQWLPPASLFASASSDAPASPHFAAWSAAAAASGGDAQDEPEEVEEEVDGRQQFAKEHLRASASELSEVVTFQPSGRWPLLAADGGPADEGREARLARSAQLWRLSQEDRAAVVQTWLRQAQDRAAEWLEAVLEELREAAQELAEVERLVELDVLGGVSIVGMTVTGASIHVELIRRWRPEVVLVEEAAEVLEPMVMALLGSSVKHLIQIGDHFQLPPRVENHELQVGHFFATSQMERLIGLKFPHRSLCAQGRMLPSMLDLVAPRYLRANVQLTTNMSAVLAAGLEPPPFLGSEVFWWDCRGTMTAGRSKRNEEEAGRALALAFYIVAQGVEPSRVTILAAYLGQAGLLRSRLAQEFPALRRRLGLGEELRQVSAEVPEELLRDGQLTVPKPKPAAQVFASEIAGSGSRQQGAAELRDVTGRPISPGVYSASAKDAKGVRSLTPISILEEDAIKVHTVDRYQGDENDYVIVSFVRSESECGDEPQTIGFLGTPEGGNRLLVALSRARRGLYLIGNSQWLEAARGKTDHWKELFSTLRGKGWMGASLVLRCPRHPERTLEAKRPADIDFAPCRQPCGAQMGCGVEGHVCPRPCHAPEFLHSAGACRVPVSASYSCGEEPKHVFEMLCYQAQSAHHFRCPFTEVSACERCPQHVLKRLCGSPLAPCVAPCELTVEGCGHQCQELCCMPCTTQPKCRAMRAFSCPQADGHRKIMAMCCEGSPEGRCGAALAQRCLSACARRLPCGHPCPHRCGEACPEQCPAPCALSLPCGHPCAAPCGAPCQCRAEVEVPGGCPRRGHRVLAACGEEATALCAEACGEELGCGHRCRGACGPCRRDGHPVCQQKCKRLLPCGHRCRGKCDERCDPGGCRKTCGADLPCGHRCAGVCGACVQSGCHAECKRCRPKASSQSA
ncbi:unnamed protein product [Prorocentrum cordatum]|uniref:AAA+ ATPase domain-containing protein n=1 Tax=Prorocentrum cordatum TaxID=2364126 RepID=A0ABN9SNL6_9DINO|nr:unnamed protein product [Polarella glacialis]